MKSISTLLTETNQKNVPSRNTVILLIAAVIIGSALVVLNSNDIYLSDKNSATVSVPDQLLSGAGGSLILQANDGDGEPAANRDVTVTLTRGDEAFVLWEGETNSDGILQPQFEVPEIVGKGNLTVTIGSESFTQEVELVSSFSIIISTDKPLYQPGQTIHLRTLTYEGKNPQASEEDVQIEIKDPDGNKIFRKVIEANEYGIAALDFALSDQLPLGNYQITASIGEASSQKVVSVQEYVLPKYSIRFEELDSWYVVLDTIEATLNASYIFGEPISGTVEIDARTYYGEWESIANFSGDLDDGLFDFTLPLSSTYFAGLDINEGNAYLELNATITDTSGHEEQKSRMVTITESPISLMSIGDTNIHGEESTYHFIARYPDGTPVGGAELTIDLNGYNLDTYGDTRFVLTADERGVVAFTFTYDQNITSIEVVASLDDHESLSYFVNLKGDQEGLKVLADKSNYELGDTATCEVHYSGTGGTNMVFYDLISGGFVIQSSHIELENDQGTIEFTMSNDMVPMVECRVYKIQSDFSVLMDSTVLTVGQEDPLDVSISTPQSTYRPGGDLIVDFLVQDSEGMAVQSALGVTIVDLSVFELQERFTGYEEIYFSLESDITEPQYQILQYAYGTGNTLPSDATTHVDASELDLGISVYQSGGVHAKNAEEFSEDTSARVIDFLLIVAVLGYLSLFLLAAKYPMNRGMFLSLIVALSILLPIGYLATTIVTDDDDSSTDDGFEKMQPGAPEQAGFQGGAFRFDDDIFMDLEGGGVDGAPPQAAGNEKNFGGMDETSQGATQKTVQEPDHIRKEFPETWVWEPTLITDENGKAHLGLVAPDTITTWRVDAIASTKDARMGIGSGNITVFQEFFVEPDIPVEVVRNDEFPLNIMVYNFESQEQEITIKLDNETWFDLLKGDPDDSDNPGAPNDPDDFFQVVTVAPSSVIGVEYVIRARDVGEHNVTITGSSNLVDGLADKVIRPMNVVPDGQLVQHIINGELTDNMTVSHSVELANDRIPNSENAYLKFQGSMDAVAIEGAEQYIRFVSGCGEQSMSLLSIDVLAYSVVKDSGSSEKLFEYEMICTQGIQHELTYLMNAKNGDGRGIVWFPSDEDVHPWLTSWGLLTFQDSINAGFTIDESIITDMQDYLISQQNDDGSFTFPERGLYEFTNPILRAKVVSTTAYITRALIYSGYPVDDHIRDAVGYIEDNVKDNWDDPYTLALSLIVLEDANGQASLADEVASRILDLKTEDNGTYSWTSENNMIGSSREMFWGRSSSNTIETTSYAVMALSKHGDSDAAAKGVKYLLTSRIGGGYFSTQDTVVAFQALTKWGAIDIEELTLSTNMNGAPMDARVIDQDNNDLTYLIDLRPSLQDLNEISITSSGEGSLLYQIVIEEYIPWEEQVEEGELILDVEYDSTDIAVNDAITATLTVSYTGSAPQIKMVLVDLKAPVGFSFDAAEFDALMEGSADGDGVFSHYELTGRQCLLYLTDLVSGKVVSGKEYQYQYSLTANKPIRASIQGVNAYDMYNPFLKDVEEPVEITSHV